MGARALGEGAPNQVVRQLESAIEAEGNGDLPEKAPTGADGLAPNIFAWLQPIDVPEDLLESEQAPVADSDPGGIGATHGIAADQDVLPRLDRPAVVASEEEVRSPSDDRAPNHPTDLP